MPKLLPIATDERRLRDALAAVLDRLGALPPTVVERTDEQLAWLAERWLNENRFAVAPELDKDLPF